MIQSLRTWIAVVALVLVAAACGGNAGGNNPVKTYSNDGYLGITNSNPSLPMTPTYHTYEVDTNMMRNAVVSIAGVQHVRIATHGPKATVRLTVSRELPENERARIQSEALQALQQAVPRYNFKVKLVTR